MLLQRINNYYEDCNQPVNFFISDEKENEIANLILLESQIESGQVRDETTM
jgi:hypothetical protein